MDVATLAEEKARAAVHAELSMFEADRTVRRKAFAARSAADCLRSCSRLQAPQYMYFMFVASSSGTVNKQVSFITPRKTTPTFQIPCSHICANPVGLISPGFC